MLIGNQLFRSFKVDGDTDSPVVQREFEKVIKEYILKVAEQRMDTPSATGTGGGLVPANLFDPSQRLGGNANRFRKIPTKEELEEQDAIVHDLEEHTSPVKRSVATISKHVSLANGHVKKNAVTLNGYGPPTQQNGHIPNGKPNFRNMLEEADNYPIHSYM